MNRRWYLGAIWAALACLLLSSTAMAVTQLDGATVSNVGQVAPVSSAGNPYGLIVLTPAGTTTPQLYGLPSNAANPIMAIALTAISSGKTVNATIDDNGFLYVLYINP